MEIDHRIERVGDAAKEAFKELYKIQSKEKLLVKTGEEMIDCHIGGLLAGDCVLLSGSPSSGKSETLYRMIDKMLSEEVNPKAKSFVSLEFSMEMKMLNKLVRSTHNMLGKRKTDILFEPFTQEEAEKVKDYYTGLRDNRRFVVQSPVSPEEFYKMTRDFCLANVDKEAIVISVDHLLLFSGTDKQAVLEKITEYVNLLKLEFSNCYFILLSQLNRGYNAIIKEKSNDMIPTNSLLYGSSFMEQLASYIIIITNPFKQGVSSYLKFNQERYKYLSEFFGDVDKNNKASFDTVGNLFFFLTKIRESDSEWKSLFIKSMDLSPEQLEKMKQSIVPEVEEKIIKTQTPVFDMVNNNTEAILSAQGGEFDAPPF